MNRNHTHANHVIFVYISAYFPSEGGGCYQALDAVTYMCRFQASLGVIFISVRQLQDVTS
jgi:hypothetical protein